MFNRSVFSTIAVASAFMALPALTGCGSSRTQLTSAASKSGSTTLTGNPFPGQPLPGTTGTTTTGGGSGSNTAVTPAKPWASSRVAGGSFHSCVIGRDLGVWCRGGNNYGQLGNGTTSTSTSPTLSFSKVLGLPTAGVRMITAGQDFTCAIDTSGAVWCWGNNEDGQLGDGTYTDRSKAVQVSGLTSGVVGLSAGGYHACAMLDSGELRCWGWNYYGQIGDNTNTNRDVPVSVGSFTGGVQGLALGGYHSCAVDGNGSLLCWGDNSRYQLGNGTKASLSVPTEVPGMGRKVQTLAMGWVHSCALMDGKVYCWGDNIFGQVGNGTTQASPTPSPVIDPGFKVQALTSNASVQTCATDGAKHIACWGIVFIPNANASVASSQTSPTPLTGLTGNVQEIEVGYGSTCALDDGGLQCWGGQPYGLQLYGALLTQALPGLSRVGVTGISTSGTISISL